MCGSRPIILLATEIERNPRLNAIVFPTRNANNKIDDLATSSVGDRLSIPLIFVNDRDSDNFVAKLREETNLRVTISVTGQGNTGEEDQRPGSGFTNGRSATTFYFVVFAFTILLLLSLTWFIFNYLRRCHHMYTVKRQRVSNLHFCSCVSFV